MSQHYSRDEQVLCDAQRQRTRKIKIRTHGEHGLIIGNRLCSKDFTLIELLVVIAVIVILAAMLLPALNKARNQAKSIACINNQKQFASAMFLYAGDSNQWMPFSYSDKGYSIDNISYSFISPMYFLVHGKYLTVPDAALCPTFKPMVEAKSGKALPQKLDINSDSLRYVAFYSFGIFEWGAARRNTQTWDNWLSRLWRAEGIRYSETVPSAVGGKTTWINYSSDRNPSRRAMSGDIGTKNGNLVYPITSYSNMETNTLIPDGDGAPIMIHGKSVNIAFVDGHVSSNKLSDFSELGIRHYRDITGTAIFFK